MLEDTSTMVLEERLDSYVGGHQQYSVGERLEDYVRGHQYPNVRGEARVI